MPNKASKAMTRVLYGILLFIVLLLAFGGCYTTVKSSSPQQNCYYRITYERLSSSTDVYVKRYKRTCEGDRFFFRQNYRYHNYGYYHEPRDRYQDYHRQDDDRTYRPRGENVGRGSGENERRGERNRDERDGERSSRDGERKDNEK